MNTRSVSEVFNPDMLAYFETRIRDLEKHCRQYPHDNYRHRYRELIALYQDLLDRYSTNTKGIRQKR